MAGKSGLLVIAAVLLHRVELEGFGMFKSAKDEGLNGKYLFFIDSALSCSWLISGHALKHTRSTMGTRVLRLGLSTLQSACLPPSCLSALQDFPKGNLIHSLNCGRVTSPPPRMSIRKAIVEAEKSRKITSLVEGLALGLGV